MAGTVRNRYVRRAWFWSYDDSPDWFGAYVADWLWRPWCWLRGYHTPHHCDVHFEVCTWCMKHLWSRSRDGSPNPFISPTVNRAPATWRRWLGVAA